MPPIYVWLSRTEAIEMDSLDVRDIVDTLVTYARRVSLTDEVDAQKIPLKTNYTRSQNTAAVGDPCFAIARADIVHSKALDEKMSNVAIAVLEVFERYAEDFCTVNIDGIVLEWRGSPIVFLENVSQIEGGGRVAIVDLSVAHRLFQKRAKVIQAERSRFHMLAGGFMVLATFAITYWFKQWVNISN